MATDSSRDIDDLMAENRKFPPPKDFVKNTLVAGTFLYDEANEDYESFWARQAAELVSWETPWDTICEWNWLPHHRGCMLDGCCVSQGQCALNPVFLLDPL